MSDDDSIAIVTRGELAELRTAAKELRRLAREAHQLRTDEADARGPRQVFGVCRCGGGSSELSDKACVALLGIDRIVGRWTIEEHKAGAK